MSSKNEINGKSNIDFLKLSPATYNALIKQHIDTPKKIANLTDKDIDRLRAIGDKRKKEVIAALFSCTVFCASQGKSLPSFAIPVFLILVFGSIIIGIVRLVKNR